MAKPVVVESVIGHLADAVLADRHPVHRHVGSPPAGRTLQSTEGTLLDQESRCPRMPREWYRKWLEVGEESAACILRERARDADMPKFVTIVVEREEE